MSKVLKSRPALRTEVVGEKKTGKETVTVRAVPAHEEPDHWRDPVLPGPAYRFLFCLVVSVLPQLLACSCLACSHDSPFFWHSTAALRRSTGAEKELVPPRGRTVELRMRIQQLSFWLELFVSYHKLPFGVDFFVGLTMLPFSAELYVVFQKRPQGVKTVPVVSMWEVPFFGPPVVSALPRIFPVPRYGAGTSSARFRS